MRRRRRRRRQTLTVTVQAAGGHVRVSGTGVLITAGTLLNAFDGDGKVLTPIGTRNATMNALVLQPDGKLVVAGQIDGNAQSGLALARYSPDGSVDPGFGSGGFVTTVLRDASALALALQPDGKLVAGGYAPAPGSSLQSVLARYNSDGSIDTVAAAADPALEFVPATRLLRAVSYSRTADRRCRRRTRFLAPLNEDGTFIAIRPAEW